MKRFSFTILSSLMAMSACNPTVAFSAETIDNTVHYESVKDSAIFQPLTSEQKSRTILPEHRLNDLMARSYADEVSLYSFRQLENVSELSTVTLPLDDVTSAVFKVNSVKKLANGMIVWEGETLSGQKKWHKIPSEIPYDSRNSATLIFNQGKISGSFNVNGNAWRITPLENHVHAIARIEKAFLPPRLEPFMVRETSAHPVTMASNESEQSVIRILTVTTNQTRKQAPDINAIIAQSFSEANQGNRNSQVHVTFEHAGNLDLNYDEEGPQAEMLPSLIDTQNPRLGKPIAELRDKLKAHIVVMLVDDYSLCGRATSGGLGMKQYAVAMVNHRCSTSDGGYTFAHEVGHLFDLFHDWTGGAESRPPYKNGYYSKEGGWNTIMSYGAQGTEVINSWSNPRLTYQGRALGTERNNDATRRINETRTIIAGYYPTEKPDTGSPVVTLDRTSLSVVATTNTGFGYKVSANSSQDDVTWKWELAEGDKNIYLKSYDKSTAEIVVPKQNESHISDMYAKFKVSATKNGKTGHSYVTINVVKPAVSITGDSHMSPANPAKLTARANFDQATYDWTLKRNGQNVSGGIDASGQIAKNLPGGDYTAEVSARSDKGRRKASAEYKIKVEEQAQNNDQAFINALSLSMQSTDNGDSVTFSGSVASSSAATSTPGYAWTLPAGAQSGSNGQPHQRFTVTKNKQVQNLKVKVKVTAGKEMRELERDITVPAQTETGQYPLYKPGTDYKAGEVVKNKNGDLFECKPWPYTGWCGSSSALHYEPGIGLNWKDAWNSK